jgi:hypothetical protein
VKGAAATLAPDAAIALGIAATAMPFAPTRAGEAERWLRVLRAHGESGVVLRALGVSEGVVEGEHHGGEREAGESSSPAASPEGDGVAAVTEQALKITSWRGAASAGTTDLLLAVIECYGEEFDRALRAHGTDRDEVLEQLRLRAT